ncbi:hypothetical protein [Formosa algae]|uniref:Uncharacterized protein n=1 Tax=Formosa algae TaxID=225843 RepID=A0A9X0YIS9_9FLAO|nr:hypothetical protein [Formosa algae]MBP1838633.1 hypothetical protein [Formosa algae]MDQ0335133.1 hypothetical protein [Formosa algae]OEI80384.1 hypothetical protein AST99_09260 [Formosa algae]
MESFKEEYFNLEMHCDIFFKNGEKIKRKITLAFLLTKFLNELYTDFNNDWDYFTAYYSDTGNIYGKMKNTKYIFSIKSRELKKVDFDCITEDNSLIDCELFLKSEPSNPRYYTINKQDFINNFVKDMYDLHGADWSHFTTTFKDSRDLAYGTFTNNAYLRKHKKLSLKGLYLRRCQINKEKWENKKNNRTEIFYVLVFKNSDFLKIGQTFREIEYRLYNYIFPKSDKELELYEGKIIDFEKSFIIPTSNTKTDIDSNLKCSLESIIIKNFESHRFENKKYKNSKELLKTESFSELKNYFDSSSHLKSMSLFEYSGFKDSLELKAYNLDKGLDPNILRFYTRKSKPTIYLKNKNKTL